MKYISLLILLLFWSCIKEKKCHLSEQKTETIYILPVWEEGTIIPEGLRVTFYSKESNKYIQDNLLPKGGNTTIRGGEYELIIYNNDSEKIRYRNISKYNIHEAYTDKIQRPSYVNPVPDEETFEQPDVLWLDQKDYVLIHETPQTITVYPKQMVKEYTGRIVVEGMEQVQAIRGAITGMMSKLNLSTQKATGKSGTIFFDVNAIDQGIEFTFRSFGVYTNDMLPRKHYLTLEFLIRNGIARQNIDVTNLMESLINGGVLKIDKIIVIPPDPTDPDGGFDADVGKWDEVTVPIPI